MSLIVAGRFTTFPAAEAAAEKLYAEGFVEEDVNLCFVNPRGQHARHGAHGAGAPPAFAASPHHTRNITAGAVAGAVVGVVLFSAFSAALPSVVIAAGVGAWIGARIGASVGDRSASSQAQLHRDRVHRETRSDGVLLSVHVCYENQDLAAQLLRDTGATDIERASGAWHDGHWADFDPTRAPMPFGEVNQRQA
jgi:hypothetical protein